MIPYGRQHIDSEDVEAVVKVLQSDFLTQGPCVPAFEHAFCERAGARYAVAVNSATSALHLACLALEVGPGDRVWTSPITFVASANCARFCGADVDFVDVDPGTGNLSVPVLESRLEQADKKGELPNVIIPVHLCGQPCDMREIHRLAREYDIRVIEDASHAVGATYQGEPVGSGRYSDITVFSFHPVKMITAGEGGMACTNHPEFAQRMLDLRSHGLVREPGRMTAEPDGPWYYEQQSLGFNYRMTDLQAALGLSQLRKLDRFLRARAHLAQRYDRLLDLPNVEPLSNKEDRESSRHLYVIRDTSTRNLSEKRSRFEALRDREVGVQVHYIPVYRQPYYRSIAGDRPRMECPNAESYYLQAMSLPLYTGLGESDQDRVISAVNEVLGYG